MGGVRHPMDAALGDVVLVDVEVDVVPVPDLALDETHDVLVDVALEPGLGQPHRLQQRVRGVVVQVEAKPDGRVLRVVPRELDVVAQQPLVAVGVLGDDPEDEGVELVAVRFRGQRERQAVLRHGGCPFGGAGGVRGAVQRSRSLGP